jgi:hypothetical protein
MCALLSFASLPLMERVRSVNEWYAVTSFYVMLCYLMLCEREHGKTLVGTSAQRERVVRRHVMICFMYLPYTIILFCVLCVMI